MTPRSAACAGVAAVAAAWAAVIASSGTGALAVPAGMRTLSSDAFLLEAGLAIVFGPIAGAALGPRRATLAVMTGSFAITSLGAALAAGAIAGLPATLAVRGHIGLAVVAAALVTLGALIASRTSDPLDAAALALALSVTASLALLAGGPATAELSERAIDAGLLANPLIAITSAGEMDLLRSDVLYQLAPISHRRFTYPSWQMTTAAYGALAAVCLALTSRGSQA